MTSDNNSHAIPSAFGDSRATDSIDKSFGLQDQGVRAEHGTRENTSMANFDSNLGQPLNTLVNFAHHKPLAAISNGILTVSKKRPSELVTWKGTDQNTQFLPEENHLLGLPMIVTKKHEDKLLTFMVSDQY